MEPRTSQKFDLCELQASANFFQSFSLMTWQDYLC